MKQEILIWRQGEGKSLLDFTREMIEEFYVHSSTTMSMAIGGYNPERVMFICTKKVKK